MLCIVNILINLAVFLCLKLNEFDLMLLTLLICKYRINQNLSQLIETSFLEKVEFFIPIIVNCCVVSNGIGCSFKSCWFYNTNVIVG